MKLNLKDIPKLGSKFWKELGGKIPGWIKADALVGLMQNNNQKMRYRSKEYTKYKANDMRRFTKGEGKTFSDKEGYFYGKTYFGNKKAGFSKKKGFGTGDRLKAYKGVSIESNNVAFVDLTLTGRMINSLRPTKSDDYGVLMSYGQDQVGKILGNKMRGYDVLGLNDKNKLLTKNEIIKELKRRKEKLIPKKIDIVIGI